jgi:hypothetical protein
VLDRLKSDPRFVKVIDYFYKPNNHSEYEIIKNGEITQLIKNISNEGVSELFNSTGADIIIYSDKSKLSSENKCVNKIIIRPGSENVVSNWESSNIQFLLVEFSVGDTKYKVNLKDNTSNYYIVNNVFTRDFFVYYLKKHFSVQLDSNLDCSLKVLDHNVSVVNVDFNINNASITIEKDSYTVVGAERDNSISENSE